MTKKGGDKASGSTGTSRGGGNRGNSGKKGWPSRSKFVTSDGFARLSPRAPPAAFALQSLRYAPHFSAVLFGSWCISDSPMEAATE